MRIRPDGVELLQAARHVIDTVIVPHVAQDCRDTLRSVEQAITLASDRLMRDVEASVTDLAALEDARAAMRGKVLEALPPERRYDARLVSKALSVATLQLVNAPDAERREFDHLAALLGIPAEPHASMSEIRCALPALNERLVARIRAGEADAGTTLHAATFAYLEATTHEALAESNPTYRRRVSNAAPSRFSATTQPSAPVDAAVAAWSDVPQAFLRAFRLDVPPAPVTQRIDAWMNFQGVVGEAVCASGNAAFATQADLFGWFAQRLAANHRVPMIAVEGAHQAHDLTLAIADASAALFELAVAPFRRPGPRPTHATRLR